MTWIAVFGFAFFAFWPPQENPAMFGVTTVMALWYGKKVLSFYGGD